MVSVIVPNYNHAPFLKERIDSILNQTYQDFELILLDDSSNDNSREILDSYKHNKKVSHIVFNEQNSGSPFSQWRKGVQLAKGEWIWIAESDDVADPLFLEVLFDAIKCSNLNIGLAYSHLKWINSEGEFMFAQDESTSVNYYKGCDFAVKKLLYTTTIFNVSSAIFRKDVLNSVDWSKFEHMRMCGDYAMYVQMAKLCDVCECEQILDSYRLHSNNTTLELTKKGWSFLEGMVILNNLVKDYNISQFKYSSYYARAIIKSDFNSGIVKNILSEFLKNKHIFVVLIFYIIKVKRYFKRINK